MPRIITITVPNEPVQVITVEAPRSEPTLIEYAVPGMQGPTGDQGPVGPVGPPNYFEMGTVVAGEDPDAEFVDLPTGQALNLVLPRGLQGVPGADSTVPGPAGPAGPTGPAGPIGPASTVAGPEGPPGPQGEKGEDGYVGADGAPGPAGPEGPAGPTGPQGPIGLTGSTGPKGDKGDTGTAGTAGAAGATGPANVISIGSVTTGPAGALAAAQMSGTSPAQQLHLTIPQGEPGPEGKWYDGGIIDYDGTGDPTTAVIRSNWGVRDDGTVYYDSAGAVAGEAALLIPDVSTGDWSVFRPDAPADNVFDTRVFEVIGVSASIEIGRIRGSGTTLPAADLRRGDSYYHTGLACSLVWNGTAWRQETDAIVADTTALTAISTTYSTILYDGFTAWVADQDSRATWSGTQWDGIWVAYTPVWTTANSAPTVGNGALTGRYRKIGRMVEITIFLSFGSTTSGGTGSWNFTVPFTSAAGFEHYVSAKSWTSSGWNLLGYGLLGGSSTLLSPWFPISPTNVNYEQARNADSGGAAGSGRPLVPGLYSFQTNSNMAMWGRYETAA